MKSRIVLDFVDFDGSGVEPVIRVDLNPSDDPRDKMLKSLFEKTNGALKIKYGHQEIDREENGEWSKRSKIYLTT